GPGAALAVGVPARGQQPRHRVDLVAAVGGQGAGAHAQVIEHREALGQRRRGEGVEDVTAVAARPELGGEVVVGGRGRHRVALHCRNLVEIAAGDDADQVGGGDGPPRTTVAVPDGPQVLGAGDDVLAVVEPDPVQLEVVVGDDVEDVDAGSLGADDLVVGGDLPH